MVGGRLELGIRARRWFGVGVARGGEGGSGEMRARRKEDGEVWGYDGRVGEARRETGVGVRVKEIGRRRCKVRMGGEVRAKGMWGRFGGGFE